MSAASAPTAAPRRSGFLERRNPLATLAATTPLMVALLFARDLATPALVLVLAVAVLLSGARVGPRVTVLVLLGLPLAVAVAGIGFAVWTDPGRAGSPQVVVRLGEAALTAGMLATGLATSLRLGAIAALALIPGLSTDGADLVRATVQHLRVPYRVGYTALAALRFVPRFGAELELIRRAHRVRGAGGRGPIAAVARWSGYPVPLLAGAIRHAERVALAMDARAFGAFPTRTERHIVPFRAADVVFVVAFWAGAAGAFVAATALTA